MNPRGDRVRLADPRLYFILAGVIVTFVFCVCVCMCMCVYVYESRVVYVYMLIMQ